MTMSKFAVNVIKTLQQYPNVYYPGLTGYYYSNKFYFNDCLTIKRVSQKEVAEAANKLFKEAIKWNLNIVQ